MHGYDNLFFLFFPSCSRFEPGFRKALDCVGWWGVGGGSFFEPIPYLYLYPFGFFLSLLKCLLFSPVGDRGGGRRI